MAVAAGWVADRFGARKTLAGISFSSGASTALIGMASDFWLPPVIFLQPALTVCFSPVGFAILSRLSPPPETRCLAPRDKFPVKKRQDFLHPAPLPVAR
jgi:MFS family permease